MNLTFLVWCRNKKVKHAAEIFVVDVAAPDLCLEVIQFPFRHHLKPEGMDILNSELVSWMTAPPPPYALPFFAPDKGHRLSDISWCHEPFDTIAMYGSRDLRREEALIFRDMYTRCGDNCSGDMEVEKTCIWARAVYSWQDSSTRITWVAMHGIDSICVVTRNKDVECLEQELMGTSGLRSFWNAIVSEVEDIEGPSQKFYESNEKPFGIVSVLGCNNKASSAVNDVGKDMAIRFLQEEMKNDTVFTFDKTVQTTISAFQHLFCQKFEADEIRVFAWNKNDVIGKELVEEREDPDIEELLAIMNEPNKDSDMV